MRELNQAQAMERINSEFTEKEVADKEELHKELDQSHPAAKFLLSQMKQDHYS